MFHPIDFHMFVTGLIFFSTKWNGYLSAAEEVVGQQQQRSLYTPGQIKPVDKWSLINFSRCLVLVVVDEKLLKLLNEAIELTKNNFQERNATEILMNCWVFTNRSFSEISPTTSKSLYL